MPPQCHNCPLQGQPQVPGVGKLGGLAVVGEAPGRTEVQQGKPFVGLSGRLLRETLSSVGLKLDDIWITNTCLCRPEDNDTPSVDAIAACYPRLVKELTQCTKALLCGAVALTAVGPEWGTITKSRGRAFHPDSIDLCHLTAVATWHPAKVLRDPPSFTDFAFDITKLINDSENPGPPDPPRITMCQNVADVRNMVRDLRDYFFVVDVEATGLDPLIDKIRLIGLQSEPDHAWQVPQKLLTNRYVQLLLKELLENTTDSGGQNVGYDSKMLLYQYEINWQPTVDSMLAHYTLDERLGTHDLKGLARQRYDAPDYERPLREYMHENKVGYEGIPLEILSPYNALDTQYTFMLCKDLPPEMDAEGVRSVHDDILIPGTLALRHVELTGVKLDIEYLKELGSKLKAELAIKKTALQDVAREYDFEDFNPSSPQQVAKLLYDELKIPKTSRGRSTEREVLELLAGKHTIVNQIVTYRQTAHMISTYIEGLLSRVSADGRVRGDFLLHGTVTGRASSRDPNLQNIPVLIGPMIRDAFIAEDGWELLDADEGQIELRVAAVLSGDQKMLQHFIDDDDIHRMIASEIFDIPPEKITEEQRYVAKYVDFGIIYGRGAKSLAEGELREWGIKKSQKFIDTLLERYPGLARWREQQIQKAIKQGYVDYEITDRRRRFPLVVEANRGDVSRQSVNSPCQGTGFDITFTAMTRLVNRLDPEKCRVLLTVHDSILFESRLGYREENCDIIRYEMTENCPFDFPIPLKVDIKVGQRWGSLVKIT